jgi:O-antigen/teichoic acid export membrane protein
VTETPSSRLAVDSNSAIGLGVAALTGNALGLLFTIVLARLLTPAEYGALAALVAAFLIVAIAGSALQITVAREVAIEFERHDTELNAHIKSWVRALVLVVAVTTFVGIALRGEIAALVGVDDSAEWGASAVLASGAAWLLLSILRGVLQGLRHYRSVALSIVGEAAMRLFFAAVFVLAGLGVSGAFLGTAASILVVSLVLMLVVREHSSERWPPAVGDAPRSDYRLLALLGRTWPALLALSLFALLQNSDVIMVKRVADEVVAGAYAADAVAAKVIIWTAIGVGFFVVPESARRGDTKDGRRVLLSVGGLVLVAGALIVAAYLLVGRELLELAFGPEYAVEHEALPVLGVAMTLLATSYLITQFFLAVRRYVFLGLLALAAVTQIVALSSVGGVPIDVARVLVVVNAVLVTTMTALVFVGRGAKSVKDAVADD